ncbi:MAG: mannosyltransferase family protein [Acidimicrobiales bacterium]
MDLGEEVVGARPGGEVRLLKSEGDLLEVDDPVTPLSGVISRPLFVTDLEVEKPPVTFAQRWQTELKWPTLVYAASRVGLLALAIICDVVFSGILPKSSLARELGNWDGWWYIRVATLGYPTHVSHAQTTLGFFPLYPMAMWLVSHVFMCSYVIGGLIVSLAGGLVATVLLQRLVTQWWGPEVAKKAVLLFCLFPGSIVFSMDYSEGLLIPLVVGCVLALHHRRWLVAGVLAALSTAIGPDALVVVAMCGTASLLQLWRYGWRDSEARRSLAAPLLAPVGAAAFALFLTVWTGSPFASYIAQKSGWHEATSIFAIPALIVRLINEVGPRFHWWNINLNEVVGLAGTAFLIVGLRWLWRDRVTLPVEVWVFVAGMTFLMVTSTHVPPNPRMLITAFPVVLIFAKWLSGRAWKHMTWVTGGSLILLSAMTYMGSIIRP